MKHMAYKMTGGEMPDNATLRWGRLVHLAVLEPATLLGLPRWKGGRRSGADWDAFADDLAGEYLTVDEFSALSSICAAIPDNAEAFLSAAPNHEQELRWLDPIAGPSKAKPDAWGPGLLVEIKTARAIDPRSFGGQAVALGYHLQLGWYARGLRLTDCTTSLHAVVIAIEKELPFDVAVYEMDAATLKWAEDRAVEIARRYRECEGAGLFPGAFCEVEAYPIPDWAMDTGAAPSWMEEGKGEL